MKAVAAASAYNIGVNMGGPLGIVLGPVFGAAAFAGVMAFESGGIVPGFGIGDTVPAMLTPGEGVVPKGVMDGLSDPTILPLADGAVADLRVGVIREMLRVVGGRSCRTQRNRTPVLASSPI